MLRNSLYVMVLLSTLATLIACKPGVPKEYIQPGDLEDILYDYYVAQALAADEHTDNTNFERSRYFLAVLKKHGVTQAEFDSSMVYYYGHLDRLKPIYLEVTLSITNSRSSLKLMSTESVMPSNHLILCCPLLFLPSIFPSIRVFFNESVLPFSWPKYWSFSFSISPSNECSVDFL